MEGLVTIKASDLTKLFEEVSLLRGELKELKENEDNSKAYTIQQTADLINVCYNTVRKLIAKGNLFAKYPGETCAKAIIPLWSIKSYLRSKDNSNQ